MPAVRTLWPWRQMGIIIITENKLCILQITYKEKSQYHFPNYNDQITTFFQSMTCPGRSESWETGQSRWREAPTVTLKSILLFYILVVFILMQYVIFQLQITDSPPCALGPGRRFCILDHSLRGKNWCVEQQNYWMIVEQISMKNVSFVQVRGSDAEFV